MVNPYPAGVESAQPIASAAVSAPASPVTEAAPVVAPTPFRIGETTLDAELAELVNAPRQVVLLDEEPSAAPIVLAQAETHDPAAMNDDELSDVRAGEFKMSMNNFDVVIQDNQAGQFMFDIAQNAFGGAQGVFTTLQAVNSAVDLTVIVNIYLGRQS